MSSSLAPLSLSPSAAIIAAIKIAASLSAALTLIVAWGAPAQAADPPPIDADGDFVHVLTFKPLKMTSPLSIAGPLNPMGWSDDAKGGTLITSDAEGLAFDAQGRLDRSRYDPIESPVWAFGEAARDASDGLIYCDFQSKSLKRLTAAGQMEPIPTRGLELEQVCQTYSDGAGGVIVAQTWPMIFWRLDPTFKAQRQGMMKIAVDRKPDEPAKICGADDLQRPLAVLNNYGGFDVALALLDKDLLPIKALWGLKYDAIKDGEFVKALGLVTVQQCAQRGKLTWFTFNNHVLIFEGDRIASALRNGTPLNPRSSLVEPGVGPYAFQVLLTARVLGGGEALVTVERLNGEVKLFARRRDLAPDKARAAAEAAMRSKSPLQAHRAWDLWLQSHPKDGAAMVAQLENMIAAGWWEAAIKLADERADAQGAPKAEQVTIARLGAEARARILRRWASREVKGAIVNVMRPDTPVALGALKEALALTQAHPASGLIRHAAALVALRADDKATFLDQLEALQKIVEAGSADAADYPELFDLHAARGDAEAMKALLSSARPRLSPQRAALWQAELLRVSGRPEEALAALSKAEPTRPALILKARLQVETGALNEGIITWTQAASMGPPDDPQIQAGLGVAYLRRGLAQLAIEALVKAHSAQPADTAHLSNLALADAQLDRREDALKQVFTALSKAPDDPLLRFQLDDLGGARAAQAPPSGDTVAIMTLTTGGGAVQRVGLGEMIAAMLTTAAVNRGLAVVERDRLDDLLAEQKLQRGGHVDRATAVKIGKLAGARRLILGNVAEFDGALRLDLRLVDAQTGQILKAAQAQSPLELAPLQAAIAKALADLSPP